MGTPDDRYHVWDCEQMLQFRCPLWWEGLDRTPQADVRHCRRCNRDVHRCRTPADFVAHGERGSCVAIPEGLSPGLTLGQPSPEEVLRLKALADRGWWEEVLLRQPDLGAEQAEAIRKAKSRLAESVSCFSPEHLAVLRMAVRDGGVRCPRCGFDIASDEYGVMIYLATSQCMACGGPIELELPSE